MLTRLRFRLGRLAGLLCLALALAACSTLDVDTDWDPNARFARLDTWGWAPVKAHAVQRDPRLESDLVHERIESSIGDVLDEEGYEKASANPDFYVAYHIAIRDAIDAHTMYNNYHIAPHFGGWVIAPDVHVDSYEVGTLLIDIIDAKTGDLIWRGRAQARLQDLDTPVERQHRTAEAVRAILERFPPKA